MEVKITGIDDLEQRIENKIKKQGKDFTDKLRTSIDRVNADMSDLHKEVKKVGTELKPEIEKSFSGLNASIEKKLQPVNKTVKVTESVEMPEELTDSISTILTKVSDMSSVIPLSEYKAHDQDEGDVDYYGYLHISGAWYIMKGIDDQQRYAAGSGDYSTAWKDREKLDYSTIDKAFQS